MTLSDVNFDVDTPEKVADLLREVSDHYADTHGELSAAWQDKHAGRVWLELSKILRRAADSCNKAVSKYV